jgi:hypothetical protein
MLHSILLRNTTSSSNINRSSFLLLQLLINNSSFLPLLQLLINNNIFSSNK